MIPHNIRYTPPPPPDFQCHVALTAIEPLLLVNGVCRNVPAAPAQAGFTITPHDHGRGLALTVAAGATVAQPLQIIHIRNADNIAPLAYANTFTLERQAQATLLVCDHTLSPDAFCTDCDTAITVAPGAHLELVWMQSEHNRSQHRSAIRIRQLAGSTVVCTIVTLHGERIENTIDVTLQDEQAGCRANGLFLIDGRQQFSTDITIRHNAGHCRSNQLFKGIVDNEATGRFHGRVIVAPDAQKTEAYQANNNLLLSKDAKMYTRPQLEIYADDVRCSHGATIGRLDEEGLFYLRSRGIGLKEARLLQQTGFVQDVLDEINILPLRERIAGLVAKRLQGEFSRCSDCELHCC
ncbi:MAG: Fe-S cluster assembly protein SufD [Prevotellaceae bacterium]|jgi:Fe-S cluster assembly protein SufD|nr:Fe-S cluster assembly protein SufD [Prevotellaceae bacterium]